MQKTPVSVHRVIHLMLAHAERDQCRVRYGLSQRENKIDYCIYPRRWLCSYARDKMVHTPS